MGLKEYRRKRDFAITPEPGVKRRRAGASTTKTPRTSRAKSLRFVVQKHDASRLHYDFRLEWDGVLKSWAVPKGPSLDPTEKTLAVQVEDHPIEYGGFEGTIPKGQYGGGTVMLWDRGAWKPAAGEDPSAALRAGKIKFTLNGKKLTGGWTLVRMHGSAGGDAKQNWLLIKEKDEFARPRAKYDVRIKEPLSILTGHDLDEIANPKSGRKPRQWRSNHSDHSTTTKPTDRAAPKKQKRSAPAPDGVASIPGARRAPQPRSLAPQLATLVEEAPEGDHWRHEIKFDGYRMLAHLEAGKVRLLTRNAKDWTKKFPELVTALASLGDIRAILDGEIVVLDDKGISHFQDLQRVLLEERTAKVVYFVFDLPYFDGYDLTACALRERQAALAPIVQAAAHPMIRFSDHIASDAAAVIRSACRMGLEGIICKRADSPYHSGERSRDWLKVKCGHQQEFVIGGYTDPKRSRIGFGSLLLGYHDKEGRLIYAGNVGAGFDSKLLASLTKKLKSLARASSALEPPATPGPEFARAHWVKPTLVAQVAFTEWTQDSRLRHPVFLGLRDDKPASRITRERAGRPRPAARVASRRKAATALPPSPSRARTRAPKRAAAAVPPPDTDATVLGVRITHPDRIVYPDSGITKLDVARYYESIADHILPHLERRPLSILRCTDGQTGECFFQKHMEIKGLAGLSSVSIVESKGPRDYIIVARPAGLISLIQMNALELHAWGSRAGDIDRPDRLIFDLDPGEGVAWKRIVEGARRIRALLEDLGLESFVKTTGGKGLHIAVPIRRSIDWDAAKSFAHAVASRLAREQPDRYLATMSKAQRKGRIFIDYLRNARGATSIAPFSTRARAGATVSMPVSWDELDRVTNADFTIESAPDRLARRKRDPWSGFAASKQSISKSKAQALIVR